MNLQWGQTNDANVIMPVCPQRPCGPRRIASEQMKGLDGGSDSVSLSE